MNRYSTVSVLDELLSAEHLSLLPRQETQSVFVSWASTGDMEVVRRMIAEEQEHREWLAEAIHERGGYPSPSRANPDAGGLHYLELHALIPRLIRDKERLLSIYDKTVTRLTGDAPAAALASKIKGRHQSHAETLRGLTATPTAR